MPPSLRKAAALTLFFAAPSLALAISGMTKEAKAEALLELGGESLDVTAEELDLDMKAGTAVLTGKVSLVRGDLKVRCPRLEIRYEDGPRVRLAKGSGGVKAELRDLRAEAPSVEVDFSENRLELQGGVRLARGEGFLQASTATIDLATSRISLKGVRGSIPVRATKP